VEPVVFVVILNTNGWEHTLACVASLDALHYPNYRVIVVDNGSEDGSPARIRDARPDVNLIEAGENRGFSAGNNIGVRHALAHGAEFVWLLNNDTTVETDALTVLVAEASKDPQIGIVGSAVYFGRDSGRLQAWGGGTVGWSLSTGRFDDSPTPPESVDYIMGASMLIRREVFETVGLLDESYFIYFEDIDFCRRAMSRGWKLAVAPESVVHHYVGGTMKADTVVRSEFADRMQARSSGIFIGKHAGPRIVAAVPLKIGGMAFRRVTRRQFGRIAPLTKEFGRGLALGLRRRREAEASAPVRGAVSGPTPSRRGG
jgi:GT2 family glycosyltransferase